MTRYSTASASCGTKLLRRDAAVSRTRQHGEQAPFRAAESALIPAGTSARSPRRCRRPRPPRRVHCFLGQAGPPLQPAPSRCARPRAPAAACVASRPSRRPRHRPARGATARTRPPSPRPVRGTWRARRRSTAPPRPRSAPSPPPSARVAFPSPSPPRGARYAPARATGRGCVDARRFAGQLRGAHRIRAPGPPDHLL